MNQLPVKASRDCPSDQQLLRLVAGDLDESDRTVLETHVDVCSSCQELVAVLCECPDAIAWREALAVKEPSDGFEVEFLERLKTQAPLTARTIEFPGSRTDDAPLGQLESYQVLRELGQGGMGAVFLARDAHLGNLVTLKILKPELAASSRDRERFSREGRAAAAVKHDHVVAVYRADTSPDFPLPYLVMEYIDGESLHHRLAERGALPANEAAVIARQVALGLSAAHERGLVHRDVKPSNIMLEAESGRAKVTDFGLARVVDAQTEQLTQQGSMVGTPAYMSPEHVLDPEQVDARSDVYGLGAVLYEMLTGVRAFSGTPHMVLAQTIHDDPRPPRKLNDGVPRDLETICLKCLRKPPGNRYPAARDVADDLQRFLQGEPIQARPVGRWERLLMWVRRNPRTAALVLGIAGLLVLITILSITSAAVVRSSWKKEAAARARADRRSAQARRAVDEMYTQVAEDWLADQPLMQPLQRTFLLRALRLYQEFADEDVTDPEARRQAAVASRRVGDIHYTLGEYRDAEAAYQQAISLEQDLVTHGNTPEDRKELAVTHQNLALLHATVNRTDEALKAYRDARELLEPLVAEHADSPEYRDHLANCLSGLSQLHKARGMPLEAAAGCRRAIDLQQDLVRQFPNEQRYQRDLATSHVHLGLSLEHAGDFDEALQAIHKGLALQNELLRLSPTKPGYRFDLANSYTHLSRLQKTKGLVTEAQATLMQVRQLQERMVAEFPSVPRHRMELGSTLSALASLQRDLGQLDEAEACFRQAIEVHAKLAEEFPDVPDHRMSVAGITNNLCGLLARTGRSEEARQAYTELVAEQERLVERFPDDMGYQVALAISCNNFGNLLENLGQPDGAEAVLRRAVETYRRLAEKRPDAVILRQNLNGSISNLCRVLSRNGKSEEAESAFRSAIESQEMLASDHPDIPDYRSELAHSYDNFGTMMDELGKPREAEIALQTALEIRDSLANKYPEVAEFRRDAASSHNNLGVFYDSTGQLDKALAPLERALQMREQLVQGDASDVQYLIDLCGTYGNLGRHFRLLGDAVAIDWFDRSIRSTRNVLEDEPSHEEAREILRNALASRALALDAAGRHAEALTDLDEALTLTQDEATKNRQFVHRARVLLHLEKYDDAVVQAEAASQHAALTGDRAYDLACVFSLLSVAIPKDADTTQPGLPEQVEQLQSQAVNLLERSRGLGFFAKAEAVQHLGKDADLDPLRCRDDFQQLLADLGTQ